MSLSSNHGLSRNNPLERHYRDVLCGRVHTPQDDSTKIAAGRVALLSPERQDVLDPIGGPLATYRRCARQIREHLAARLDTLLRDVPRG